jgi:hypothetical protein
VYSSLIDAYIIFTLVWRTDTTWVLKKFKSNGKRQDHSPSRCVKLFQNPIFLLPHQSTAIAPNQSENGITVYET